MAVLVLGGYGLIGEAIVERLRREGVAVIGSGRRVTEARRRWPDAEWREGDLARLDTPAAWTPLLRDVEVVVNAAGLLQQGLTDDAAALQHRAMPALYAAARTAGVRRIVQIFAAGATHGASTAFMRDKAEADAALIASDVEAVVLRPGLVVARAACGGTAMLRGLAAFPFVAPVVHGASPIQTVSIEDVVDTVWAAVRGAIPDGAVLDLVEPKARSLAETIGLFRQWLGWPPARPLLLPTAAAGLVSAGADVLGWLGWRSPLRSTSITVIRDGVTGDPGPLGRPLKALPQTLAGMPAGVQERWFARLWLLKPVILAGLSVFWLASGVTGLLRLDAATALLTDRQASQGFATVTVLAGGIVDVALGLAVLLRPAASLALKGMIFVSLSYLVGGTLLAPDLWLDPLGPLVKVAPAILLAVVGLAVLEER